MCLALLIILSVCPYYVSIYFELAVDRMTFEKWNQISIVLRVVSD